jgi:hypothetical protein
MRHSSAEGLDAIDGVDTSQDNVMVSISDGTPLGER